MTTATYKDHKGRWHVTTSTGEHHVFYSRAAAQAYARQQHKRTRQEFNAAQDTIKGNA